MKLTAPILDILHCISAGCSPVCGSAADALYASHSLVVTVLVRVLLMISASRIKTFAFKLRYIFGCYDMTGVSPGCSRLRCEIAVSCIPAYR